MAQRIAELLAKNARGAGAGAGALLAVGGLIYGGLESIFTG